MRFVKGKISDRIQLRLSGGFPSKRGFPGNGGPPGALQRLASKKHSRRFSDRGWVKSWRID